MPLRFPKGSRPQLRLEGDAIVRVIGTVGPEFVQDLVGRPFSELAPGLPVNTGRLPDPVRSR